MGRTFGYVLSNVLMFGGIIAAILMIPGWEGYLQLMIGLSIGFLGRAMLCIALEAQRRKRKSSSNPDLTTLSLHEQPMAKDPGSDITFVVEYDDGRFALVPIDPWQLREGDHVARLLVYEMQGAGLIPMGKIKDVKRAYGQKPDEPPSAA
jgi:hypothetical protein